MKQDIINDDVIEDYNHAEFVCYSDEDCKIYKCLVCGSKFSDICYVDADYQLRRFRRVRFCPYCGCDLDG